MALELWLGTGKVDITPEYPIPLAGFAFRSGPFDGVTRPLKAKVSLFQQPCLGGGVMRRTLVVQADLIALSDDVLPNFANELERRYGLAGADVLYSGTHTHSGPIMRIGAVANRVDAGYVQLVEARLLEAVAEAFAGLEPVSVRRAMGVVRSGSIVGRKWTGAM